MWTLSRVFIMIICDIIFCHVDFKRLRQFHEGHSIERKAKGRPSGSINSNKHNRLLELCITSTTMTNISSQSLTGGLENVLNGRLYCKTPLAHSNELPLMDMACCGDHPFRYVNDLGSLVYLETNYHSWKSVFPIFPGCTYFHLKFLCCKLSLQGYINS